jgi:hydroxypyruvate isomerase
MSIDHCPFTLAVCAEMIFLDLPFIERVKHLHELGFAVEIWDWTGKDIDALRQTGARFTSMVGYIDGNLTDDGKIERLLDSARRSIEVAKRLDCAALTVHGTGLGEGGIPVDPVAVVTPAMWLKARDIGKYLRASSRPDRL